MLVLWLILHSALALASAKDVLTTRLATIGGVPETSVFTLNGAMFLEPKISFKADCPMAAFDHVHNKYKIALPVSLDLKSESPLLKEFGKSASVITYGLSLDCDSFLQGSGIYLLLHLLSNSEASLIILADDFERYRQTYLELVGNPRVLERSLKFIVDARVDSVRVRFDPMYSVNAPSISCPMNQWIVFQRRVDSQVSFVQNWDTYAKGFGDPSGNFWMGLEELFLRTATNEMNNASGPSEISRCQLRVEVVTFDGTQINAEWGMFQVFEPKSQFRLRVGQNRLNQFDQSNAKQTWSGRRTFSTYDAGSQSQCSKHYGFSGWWFNDCYQTFMLNGVYPTPGWRKNADGYMTAFYDAKWVLLKSSVMMIKCSS